MDTRGKKNLWLLSYHKQKKLEVSFCLLAVVDVGQRANRAYKISDEPLADYHFEMALHAVSADFALAAAEALYLSPETKSQAHIR